MLGGKCSVCILRLLRAVAYLTTVIRLFFHVHNVLYVGVVRNFYTCALFNGPVRAFHLVLLVAHILVPTYEVVPYML